MGPIAPAARSRDLLAFTLSPELYFDCRDIRPRLCLLSLCFDDCLIIRAAAASMSLLKVCARPSSRYSFRIKAKAFDHWMAIKARVSVLPPQGSSLDVSVSRGSTLSQSTRCESSEQRVRIADLNSRPGRVTRSTCPCLPRKSL